MEKLIVEEICKNLKWYESVVAKIFKKISYKIYRIGLVDYFNYINK